ncbi:TPA: ATP-binding protein [Legionella pneumophila]|uniref:AAA family ATPase n=1 Tax=Legionella pneumophila TaxID=446 RepID=UPI0007707AF3|nr:ATP-binding protein [Legionella pneumophila]HAT9118303.1 AAA family ATPase [Legionella pneumophila subsp. pneumophila]CZJ16615.1 Predicted ATPase [Legionella pneumophila]CZJ25914.1 Predicted ATPase [Legionella pneumophila]CZJ26568.1 Predicted ATPase [Legionella pneumophila]CZJ29690.1 Predicted ATPase [Legionella pneumophila]
MLIKFTVENWESIRDPITLSMIATKERQHAERLPIIEKYGLRLLPIAAIYGANASGKTKISNAIWFAKRFITTITQPESLIPRIPFKLDKVLEDAPTRFSFQILVNETCYEFSFAVTTKKIVEEKLIKFSSYSEKVLYQRDSNGKVTFPDDPSLNQDQRLKFIAEGTRDNQLFLTKTVDQNKEDFLPIYKWFKNNLIVLGPNSVPSNWGHFIQKENVPTYSMMNDIISKLDTGITHLDGVDVTFENIQLPDALKTKISEDLSDGQSLFLGGSLVISKKNGTLSAKKLVSYHKSVDGHETEFDLIQESDGTLRMIELLPAIINLSEAKSNKTYIIDEFDHSMHTMLVRSLLEYYLQSCSSSSRSQLLFTTHNLMLMDQDLFRRDELWITERNRNSSTQLISLSEYKDVRNDKDIRKSYLKGSFGGIPKIFLTAH